MINETARRNCGMQVLQVEITALLMHTIPVYPVPFLPSPSSYLMMVMGAVDTHADRRFLRSPTCRASGGPPDAGRR